MSIAIQTHHLGRDFPSHAHAVNDVTIDLHTNKFYAIMGHSGSGKTTLLQLLGLLDKPTNGKIFVMGQDVSSLNTTDQAAIRMQHIGIIFQSYYLNNSMTVLENVMLPMHINPKLSHNPTAKTHRALAVLKELNIDNLANLHPKQLSGGQQQVVAIARALANDPPCILADEPTGNLDYEDEIKVFTLLKNISNMGKCILVVTHNDIVEKYADEVKYMNNGNLKSYNK